MWILEINFCFVKKSKSIAIILIILFQAVLSFGQVDTHLIDSLEKELSKDILDTTRVRVLIKLADTYTFADFQKSIQYAKEATTLAIKTENPKLNILLTNNLH
jgi:hypothetical protein